MQLASGVEVLFPHLDERLRAVGRSDAKVRRTTGIGAPSRTKISGPCIVAHGRLVLGTEDGNVLAVDTANGRRAGDLRHRADDDFIRPALCGGRSTSAPRRCLPAGSPAARSCGPSRTLRPSTAPAPASR